MLCISNLTKIVLLVWLAKADAHLISQPASTPSALLKEGLVTHFAMHKGTLQSRT